jgi:hypothetical protein
MPRSVCDANTASDLVHLHLRDIPPTGYISPKVMAVCLATVTLPRLEAFRLLFQSRFQSSLFFHPDLNHPSPITWAVLLYLDFEGPCEYLEDLVARIDCPKLDEIKISYLDRVNFQVVQLSEFFDRLLGPERSPFRHATVRFFDCRRIDHGLVDFETYQPTNHPGSDWHPARCFISRDVPHWQTSAVSQVLNQFSPILSTVVHLRFATEFRGIFLQFADDLEWYTSTSFLW